MGREFWIGMSIAALNLLAAALNALPLVLGGATWPEVNVVFVTLGVGAAGMCGWLAIKRRA